MWDRRTSTSWGGVGRECIAGAVTSVCHLCQVVRLMLEPEVARTIRTLLGVSV